MFVYKSADESMADKIMYENIEAQFQELDMLSTPCDPVNVELIKEVERLNRANIDDDTLEINEGTLDDDLSEINQAIYASLYGSS